VWFHTVCVCAVCGVRQARRLVTLVDLVYEAHTLDPGGLQLCVSAQVPPHQLFLPLLGAAGGPGSLLGVTPSL